MSEHSPIDPQVIFRMRETIRTIIAQRSASISEAAAEARGLGRGMAPALPATVIAQAVVEIPRDLGAYQPPPPVCEHDGTELRPATLEEVADSLAHAMRFNDRGKARRTGVEWTAQLAANELVRHLSRSGFVVMRGPPARQHSV